MKPDRWQQIEQLYRDALGRPEGERTAFLKQACGGDEGLRREVESLLAHAERTGSFLETPVMQEAGKGSVNDQNRGTLPRQLGSYHILSQIGVGGMGEEIGRAHV